MTAIEHIKAMLKPLNYKMLSGYGLEFEDFINGKAFEQDSGTSLEMICISNNGFSPYTKTEDAKYSSLSELITVYIRTQKDIETETKQVLELLNKNNNYTDNDNNNKLLDLSGAYPMVIERGKYVFQIDYIII